jgi:lysozyme
VRVNAFPWEKFMATSAAAQNPNASLTLSPDARQRMRNREAVRGYYNDGGGNRGHCTYGIGILAHRGPCTPEELSRPLTATQIEASFSAAVREAERAVQRNVTQQALTQAQFDALVSFTYNTGVGHAQPVYRRVNLGDLQGAATAISTYTNSTRGGHRVHMRGLIERRQEESAPFRQSSGQ